MEVLKNFLTDSSKRDSHRRQLDAADRIVGISKKTSNSIKEVYPDYSQKLVTVYNGYDFESILEKSKEKIAIEIAPQSICTIGRIEENKGSDRVVEVIKLLQPTRQEIPSLLYRGWGHGRGVEKTSQRVST